MNVKEGMRRLGLLLGVCGGILGGCLAYGDAAKVWENHAAHRRFLSLLASPTMQKVARAVPDKGTIGSKATTTAVGRTVLMDGVTHHFPADATDDEIRQALSSETPKSNKFGEPPASKFVPPPPIPDDPSAAYQKPKQKTGTNLPGMKPPSF